MKIYQVYSPRNVENGRVAVDCVLSKDMKYTFYYVRDNTNKNSWKFDGHSGMLKVKNAEKIANKLRLYLISS
ncbi:hypothetical protein [Bacillus thuringiensis]|uniref:hypothetical protein n=1 Tax=Bacillus thuringiensis TaxID=1428 RepID=UPI000BFB868C|nr:hypothetical protein [Bacillus thuringiensis]PGQ49757.1 hypothetical protein COA20_05395 [Bacillus thuringiensis]